MAHNQLAQVAVKPSGVTSAGVRLSAVELKREIHDSGICHVALEMAKQGKRPVFIEGEVVWEDLSEAGHLDIIKFMVKKVLPDAKEYDSVEDRKSLDHWADVIAADAQVVKV